MNDCQAFPVPAACTSRGEHNDFIPGMTLRDYFAAKAMQALITQQVPSELASREDIADWAFEMADAMLVVRSTFSEKKNES